MKKIKINFADFWPDFDKNNNYFINLLREDYEVEISDNPDYLFFSVFGSNNKYYNCIKIFYSGENIGPDFTNCHYSMCFDKLDDERQYVLPLYLLYGGYYDLINKSVDNSLVNRKFCNFIVSNGGCKMRNHFYEELSKYKRIDSGGAFMNNIGYRVGDKIQFQSQYKFALAFENDAYRDRYDKYTSEKIMQPMQANSIPIYWGNPLIHEEFNTKSFINYFDFSTEKEMIEYIIHLDNNDEEYLKVLREPWLPNNEIIENNKIENIKSFLHKIIEKHGH